MYVSSSLERIPQAAPIGKSPSFIRVNNYNGNNKSDSGKSLNHITASSSPTSSSSSNVSTTASSTSSSVAIENATPPPHSPTLPTSQTSNAAAASFIPIPTTRSTCHIKPLAENHIENEVEENAKENSIQMKTRPEEKKEKLANETREGDIYQGFGKKEESEEAIRAQITKNISTSTSTNVSTSTTTTPSSTYSRYDIYRWRERPFGPSYRRKERQRREQELLMEENNNTLNRDRNGETRQQRNEEGDDFFHSFINRFTSPQTYYEEEYSYEPEKQISSMKTVLRTRSMINLEGDDGKVLVRKTLSDANLDQDKNTNFRFGQETNINNISNNGNRLKEKHHYFGYLDLQNHYQEKRDENDIYKQKKTQSNDIKPSRQNFSDIEEGTFRQRLRDLLVNNELVIQPRRNLPLDTPNNRRCFYHPVRINRELIDEELPDPDQVKLARDRFEKVLKIKGPEAPKGLQRTASVPPGQRITPEVRVPLTHHSNTLPAKITQSNEKWTDSGSLSSGVSSASEDVEDQLHEVSSEVMQKIRACGTTVTYYGGKVIAQSNGPPSPLTSTIMEEIKFRLEVRDRLHFEEYHSSTATN